MRPLMTALLLAGIAVLAAPTAVEAQRGDRNRLTAEEIAEKPEITNAYDAVRVLRPNFLRVRSSGSWRTESGAGPGARGPVVYLDEMRYGGVSDLRNLRVDELVEIRFITANEAIVRYGNGHEYGALLITSTRRAP